MASGADTGAGAERVHVALGEHAYDIRIEAGALARAGALIVPHLPPGPVLVIADQRVAMHHAMALTTSLAEAGCSAGLATLPAGEEHKTVATCERLWQACAEHGVDRSGAIVALGGGVTGDVAGFVAATWMRGVALVQVPTTLLAMVDAAVGGKTGVNSPAGKNLIGAFKQPAFVLIDPGVLATMDDREYRAGLAEVLKYGVIRDADFLAWQEAHAAALAARDPAAVAHAVATSCRIKAWYVERDEREQGARAHLNYGHTFGHALERETGYRRYLHGEAVSIGMTMAAHLSRACGALEDDALIARQRALAEAYGLPVVHRSAEPAAEAGRLTAACRLDKKARAGRTRFVVARRAGTVEVIDDPGEEPVRAAFLAGIEEG